MRPVWTSTRYVFADFSDDLDGAHSLVLTDKPGAGQPPIATALGVRAVERRRKKARLVATVDLTNAIEQKAAMNKANRLAERRRLDLVILDETGRLPFSPPARTPLLCQLYERTNVAFSTNFSCSKKGGVLENAMISAARFDRRALCCPTPKTGRDSIRFSANSAVAKHEGEIDGFSEVSPGTNISVTSRVTSR